MTVRATPRCCVSCPDQALLLDLAFFVRRRLLHLSRSDIFRLDNFRMLKLTVLRNNAAFCSRAVAC